MKDSPFIRKIYVDSLDKFTEIHPNKNRHYTQLYPGRISAHFSDANLGNLQIMHESFNVGARIQAAPPAQFIPFGFILPNIKEFNFCGYQAQKNSFIQAGGGTWDVKFKQQLDYVGSVFDRKSFIADFEVITGTPFKDSLSESRINEYLKEDE